MFSGVLSKGKGSSGATVCCVDAVPAPPCLWVVGYEATLCSGHLLWSQLTSQHLACLPVFSDVLSGYLPNTCQGFPAPYPTLTLSSAVCVYVCMYVHVHTHFTSCPVFLRLKRCRMCSSLTGFPFLH